MKLCKTCGLEKDESEYYVREKRTGKLRNDCKPCVDEKNRLYREANRDSIRKANNDWHFRHREVVARKKRAARNKRDEDAKRAVAEREKRYREEKKLQVASDWLAANGTVPLCECGCGEHVAFGKTGLPNRFINGHSLTLLDRRADRLDVLQRVPRVDIDTVRRGLRTYKEKSGLTWKEIAEKAGLSHHHLKSILYDNAKNQSVGIEHDLVENMFRRLLGHSAPPSRHMLAEQAKLRRRVIVMPDGERYLPMGAQDMYYYKLGKQRRSERHSGSTD